jgi:hypothetical protein
MICQICLPYNQECTKAGISTQAQALEYLDKKVSFSFLFPFTKKLNLENLVLVGTPSDP